LNYTRLSNKYYPRQAFFITHKYSDSPHL